MLRYVLPFARRGPAADSLQQRFQGISEKDIAVGEVSCLGQCDGAPAVSINDRIYRSVTTEQAEALVFTALGGTELPEMPAEEKTALLKSDPYAGGQQYGALRQLIASRDWDGVIMQLRASGLSGLGGAGFPTGMKWEAVRKAPGQRNTWFATPTRASPAPSKTASSCATCRTW